MIFSLEKKIYALKSWIIAINKKKNKFVKNLLKRSSKYKIRFVRGNYTILKLLKKEDDHYNYKNN